MIKKIKMSDIPKFTIEMIDFAKFLEEDKIRLYFGFITLLES